MATGVATEVAKGCDDMGCCVILKSGKNIGKKCGVRCVNGVGENNTEIKYCKKHSKLYSNT
jgi:hypothetical protein